MNLNHTPEYWYGLRIPHQYRTPYLSTGTEGVRYTGKNWFLGTEMVRNTGNIWKLSTGTDTGKIGGKITVRSTVRCTDRFWKAKYGYGIRTEHIRVLDQSIINTQSNLKLEPSSKSEPAPSKFVFELEIWNYAKAKLDIFCNTNQITEYYISFFCTICCTVQLQMIC